jgi:toxin FitB
MNLVDSSGWLEYLADGPNAAFFAPALEATADLLVSTINIYEVFKRVLQQRGKEEALRAVALMEQTAIAEVTAPISMSAAQLSVESGLPMADSLILATARAHSAVLWTQDAHFEGIDGVRFVKK